MRFLSLLWSWLYLVWLVLYYIAKTAIFILRNAISLFFNLYIQWCAGLCEGGARCTPKHFETKIFPNLNHLFQNCDSGLPTEYGTIEETMAEGVIEEMLRWVEKVK